MLKTSTVYSGFWLFSKAENVQVSSEKSELNNTTMPNWNTTVRKQIIRYNFTDESLIKRLIFNILTRKFIIAHE